MDLLNLPKTDLQITSDDLGRSQIYDIIRKKNIILTPEEWVRQHFIHFLINHLKYPVKLIKVESGHSTSMMNKRTDIIIYDNSGYPVLLVECKKADETIDHRVFEQVIRYNSVIRSRFIVVTNGMKHFCSEYEPRSDQYKTRDSIPDYASVKIS